MTVLACVDRSSCNDYSSAKVSSEDAESVMYDASGKSCVMSSGSDEEDCRELP